MGGATPLRDRTVVVTGAARGVGEETARHLVRRGARVALLGHEESRLRQLARSLGDRTAAWEVDITDEAAMTEVAGAVSRRLGRPSAVVANAGVAAGGPLQQCAPETWRRVIEVNLMGSVVTARVFLPDLLATRGYFLQVASLAAIGPAPMMTAYCASKAGVEAFAHALRAEVAHRGVAVGVAYLGWTDTEMIRAADRYAALRDLREAMPPPAGRVRPPDAVAARLVRGIEHRATAVYTPLWQRAVQLVRPAVPSVVARGAARKLRRRPDGAHYAATGLLGAGGEADSASRAAQRW